MRPKLHVCSVGNTWVQQTALRLGKADCVLSKSRAMPAYCAARYPMGNHFGMPACRLWCKKSPLAGINNSRTEQPLRRGKRGFLTGHCPTTEELLPETTSSNSLGSTAV